MSRLTEKELLIKKACMVCCPLCDEKICIGRYICNDVQRLVKKWSEVAE